MDADLYFAQNEQKINSLIGSKKYSEAYNFCKQLLLRFPEEKRILKLKSRIEKEVEAENEKVVEEKLDAIKPLFKSENYTEILKTLKDLLNFAPNNGKIKKLYLETQEKYQKKVEELQQDFIKTQSNRLNDLLAKAPNILLESLFELEKENPGNKTVLDLTANFRDKLISKKITEKEELIYSDKYQDIQNLIEQLKKIDEKNSRIQELEKLIHARQHQTQITQKGEFIYAGEKHLETLMKLKKYDKALKAAEELLSVQTNNQKVRKIFKAAEIKYLKLLHSQTVDTIVKNKESLKSEYSQSPDKFIVL